MEDCPNEEEESTKVLFVNFVDLYAKAKTPFTQSDIFAYTFFLLYNFLMIRISLLLRKKLQKGLFPYQCEASPCTSHKKKTVYGSFLFLFFTPTGINKLQAIFFFNLSAQP